MRQHIGRLGDASMISAGTFDALVICLQQLPDGPPLFRRHRRHRRRNCPTSGNAKDSFSLGGSTFLGVRRALHCSEPMSRIGLHGLLLFPFAGKSPLQTTRRGEQPVHPIADLGGEWRRVTEARAPHRAGLMRRPKLDYRDRGARRDQANAREPCLPEQLLIFRKCALPRVGKHDHHLHIGEETMGDSFLATRRGLVRQAITVLSRPSQIDSSRGSSSRRPLAKYEVSARGCRHRRRTARM